MIFVTVGTHEQPFNRLVQCVDELVRDKIINEEVVIQTGYCTYEPQYCKWSKLLSYNEMKKKVLDARIVITHGGPASFIMPLQEGKIPIVIPRQKKYGEHVNNHQVDFVTCVAKRMGNIIPVIEIFELKNIVLNYEDVVRKMTSTLKSNNFIFNNKLEGIVNEMMGDK